MTARLTLILGCTGSGKGTLGRELAARVNGEIISIDSMKVYRRMNIGTAKPDAETLKRVPHRLIDIRHPEESYSAGEFVRDAHAAIDASNQCGRIPLLVGGTMMYFRALTEGIADLPAADAEIRAAIDAEAEACGWPALHLQLAAVDASAAARINANDSQRIQRALEVYRVSGKSLSEWQAGDASKKTKLNFLKIAMVSKSRSILHESIARRLRIMMENGFVEEVERLMARPGLTASHPSMRAVGYRQIWSHLEGKDNLEDAHQKTLAATRQLAKRQLTWLRSERHVRVVDPLETDALATISAFLRGHRER